MSEKAVRHGWVGCNILLKSIPDKGKIFYVKDGKEEPKQAVLKEWKETLFLREEKEILAKGWLLETMKCVDRLKLETFALSDVYIFEKELSQKYPANTHIKDKIRQQLQILRDKGYIKFVGRGKYRLT